MVRERNYGIDFLRLVLMFMVCVLHTLGHGGVLDACEAGSANYKVYWFIEILSYCAVDGFALISGYTATDRPQRFDKLVNLWFQAFFYSFVVTLILTVAGINPSWSKKEMIRSMLPVTYGKFWYFTAYFASFFAMPVLNKYIFGVSEETAKKALVIIGVLFSVMGVIQDPFKTQKGYSAIWLMVLYCIGGLSRRVRLFETRKSITLIIVWMCCILASWAILIYTGIDKQINYVSPTILLSGMIMVVLFSRLRFKGMVRIIAKLSPLAFGIYLFQNSQVIWNVYLKDAVAFVVNKDIIPGVACVFAFAALVFVSGLVVEFFRSRLAAFLRIPTLSRKIVSAINSVLEKLFVFLK